MKVLDDAEAFAQRLEREQNTTLKQLREVYNDSIRELLGVFQSAYPNAELNFWEQHVLDSAAPAASAVSAGAAGSST